MTLHTKQYVERILIVLNENGSFKDGHQEKITMVMDDSFILGQRQEQPEPLNEKTFQSLMESAVSVVHIDALNKSILDKDILITEKTNEIELLNQKIQSHIEELNKLKDDHALLEKTINDQNAIIENNNTELQKLKNLISNEGSGAF